MCRRSYWARQITAEVEPPIILTTGALCEERKKKGRKKENFF
jgi:hypothetical protein